MVLAILWKSTARIKLKLADKSISCEKFSTRKVSAKNRLFWENNNLNFMALKKKRTTLDFGID